MLLLFGTPQWICAKNLSAKSVHGPEDGLLYPCLQKPIENKNYCRFEVPCYPWMQIFHYEVQLRLCAPLLDLFASSPSCVHRARPVTAGSDCGEKTIPTKSNQDGCTMQIAYFGPIKQRLVKTNTTYTHVKF